MPYPTGERPSGLWRDSSQGNDMDPSAELIVLHTTKFGENSIVMHTLSREYGRRSFLVKGAGRKVAMSLFLPMNIIEAEIRESSRVKLFTASHLSSVNTLPGIRGNLYKNAISLFISEVLYRVIKDGAIEPGLYEWCRNDLLLLEALGSDFSNFHIRFLLELTVELGFAPGTDDFVPFAGDHMDMMDRLLKASFSESMLIPMSGELRNSLAEEILRYIEYHIESSVNINSLKVLRELFSYI